MRRARPGLPSGRRSGEPSWRRLVSTLAYAKGTTSMGIPWVHF
jgi:hypothetical protein